MGSIQTIGGGIEAYLFPFANGRGNLGFELGGSHIIVKQEGGEDQGIRMTSIDPRIKLLYGLGHNKGALLLEAGYSPVFVTSESDSVDYRSAGYGFIGVNYLFGPTRPLRFGMFPK